MFHLLSHKASRSVLSPKSSYNPCDNSANLVILFPFLMEKLRLREIILLAEGTAEHPDVNGHVLRTTEGCVWPWTKRCG